MNPLPQVPLSAVADAVRRAEIRGDTGVQIREVAFDSREVPTGALFFCVPGGRFDGHDLAPEALGKGAAALVVERELPLDAPQLVVESVRAAMPAAAVTFFDDPTRELEIAGITGVTSAEDVTGPYDVIVRAQAEDVDQLGQLVVAQVQGVSGITRTLTCPVVHLS